MWKPSNKKLSIVLGWEFAVRATNLPLPNQCLSITILGKRFEDRSKCKLDVGHPAVKLQIYLPRCLGQETAKRFLVFRSSCQCLFTIRGGGFTSGVVRGGRGDSSPPIGLSTKMQNKKNDTFLALLRLFVALELT